MSVPASAAGAGARSPERAAAAPIDAIAATIDDESAAIVLEFLAFARPYLARAEVTEIAVNRPGELWYEAESRWRRDALPGLTLAQLRALAATIASLSESDLSESRPILSAMLPHGERIQIVVPPACEPGTVALTIRKPSSAIVPLEDYAGQGYFAHVRRLGARPGPEARAALAPIERALLARLDEAEAVAAGTAGEAGDGVHYERFLREAVLGNRCIVVCGETGSGKTTLMKSLMQEVPISERLITIEDVPELVLPLHPNRVHLRYDAEASAAPGEALTATTLLRSCLRMKPTRIVLAELRGAETWDFLNVAASGHGGSITSCHAGGCDMAFHRLAMMVLQSREGRAMPHAFIDELLLQVIDVVVHVHHDTAPGGRGRHVTELWYDPLARRRRTAR